MKSAPVIWAIAIILTALCPAFSGPSLSEEPRTSRAGTIYINGDWDITNRQNRSDSIIILTGNLTVQAAGFLELSNVTLKMNCSFGGQFNISVQNGTCMAINNGSFLTTEQPGFNYSFTVTNGSILWVNDSTISCCGVQTPPMGIWTRGIFINSSRADFLRATLSNSYSAITATGSLITLNGTNVTGNGYGLTLNQSTATLIDTQVNGSPSSGADFRFNNSYSNFINSTSRWDKIEFTDVNSRINVSWYFFVRTMFLEGGPARDVNVTFKNVYNVQKLVKRSDTDGWVLKGEPVRELYRTSATTSYDSPYILLAERYGVSRNTTSPINLNLTTNLMMGIDAFPPVVSFTKPTVDLLNYSTVKFEGNTSDNQGISLVELSKDGFNWNAATSSGPFSMPWGTWNGSIQLSEGTRTVQARATDLSGQQTLAMLTVTIDITKPAIEVFSPAPNCVTNAVAINIFGKTEAGANMTVEGIPVNAADGYFNASVTLGNGLNRIDITARDPAGNVGNRTILVYRDTVLPNITVISPENNILTNQSQYIVQGTADTDSTVYLTGDPVSLHMDNDGYFTATVYLVAGNNRVEFRAIDPAGNAAIAFVNIFVDQVAPFLTASVSATLTNRSFVDIYGETESYVNVTIAGTRVEPAANNSFLATVPVEPGINTITVIVTDRAGNTNSTTLSVTMDNTPPVLTIREPTPNSVLAAPEVNVSGSAEDASDILKVEIGVDGTNFTLMTGTTVWKGHIFTGDGNHTFTVIAHDKAGNTVRETRAVSYRPPAPDRTPPTIIIRAPVVTEVGEKTQRISVASSDISGVSKVEISLDGATWNEAQYRPADGLWWSDITLKAGHNSIQIRSTDINGNVANTTKTLDYIIQQPPKPLDWTPVALLGIILGCAACGGLFAILRKKKKLELPEPAKGEEEAVISFPPRNFRS